MRSDLRFARPTSYCAIAIDATTEEQARKCAWAVLHPMDHLREQLEERRAAGDKVSEVSVTVDGVRREILDEFEAEFS